MTNTQGNIILIGMPGSGKSTVGVILAKQASKGFIDTDVLIQMREGKTLQEIVDSQGHMALRRIEEGVLLSIDCRHHVISTGGSAPYSARAMDHLKKSGIVVFLDADLVTLRQRIGNFDSRGLAKRPDQSFEDLYRERMELYMHYADITIDSCGHSQEEVSGEILARLIRKTADAEISNDGLE